MDEYDVATVIVVVALVPDFDLDAAPPVLGTGLAVAGVGKELDSVQDRSYTMLFQPMIP